MRKIPEQLKKEMESDPYYKQCCVTGIPRTRAKIEWHHNFIFAGQQVNEKWCILPLAKFVHDQANDKKVREYLDWIMLNRSDEETLKRYSKSTDLIAKRDRLNKIYENKKNRLIL